MASLRKYKRSPYWYLRYRDLETGRWCEEATKMRHDDPKETRDARRLAEKYSVKEAAFGLRVLLAIGIMLLV